MAIGGESTGWLLEQIDGKPINSIQVSYPKAEKLEKLENQRVNATGKIGHRQGVETGEQPVLEVSTIKPAQARVPTVAFNLSDSQWRLEYTGGGGVLDHSQATLSFPEQTDEHFEWKDPYLLIYCKGLDKPLRFTQLPP